MAIIYHILMYTGAILVSIVGVFNKRVKLWLRERRGNLSHLKSFKAENPGPVIWFHAASLGEYEQALPVIKQIKVHQPEKLICFTFFSPSGKINAADNPDLDWCGYLPLDTITKMSRFIDTMQPEKVIIVKNEWWWNMLALLKQKQVPTYSIDSLIQPSTYFIKYPFSFFKDRLQAFRKIFVINESSKQLLSTITDVPIRITADTKIEQAGVNVRMPFNDYIIEQYMDHPIIYGSIWTDDLEIIASVINETDGSHIIFPHDISPDNIKRIQAYLPEADIYSQWNRKNASTLIVDKIGILKYAYRYGERAYVGGGFGEGLHNVVEALVYKIPTACHPDSHPLTTDLIENELLYPINSSADFKEFISFRFNDNHASIIQNMAHQSSLEIYRQIFQP